MILSDLLDILIVILIVAVVILVHNLRLDENKLIECENTTHNLVLTRESLKVFKTKDLVPLSVLNNNPINIKRVRTNKWIGSIYKKGVFESFSSERLGIRASIIVINRNIDSTNSVEDFVNRIVTASEGNDTKMYTNYLKYALGYKGKIKKQDNITVLKSMIFLEGGTIAVKYFEEYLACNNDKKLKEIL